MSMPVRIDYYYKEGFLMRRVWYSYPNDDELIGEHEEPADSQTMPTEDEIMAELRQEQDEYARENEEAEDEPQGDPAA